MALSHFLSLFGRLGPPFLIPAKTASAVARRRGQGRPFGRRAGRASLDGDEHGRTLGFDGRSPKTPRVSRATVGLLLLVVMISPGRGHGAEAPGQGAPTAAAIQEASRRFGVPTAWIEAVIAAESGGDPGATSPKGAMGLMQLMPATWRELTAQIGLGEDAFDRRANIIAGTAYLRRLYDRFGPRGFLAAYNAGPARYQAVLDGRGRMPAETLAYVARIEAHLGWSSGARPARAITPSSDWRASGLFVWRPITGAMPRDRASMISIIEAVDQEPRS